MFTEEEQKEFDECEVAIQYESIKPHAIIYDICIQKLKQEKLI
jgi:hypothetical protein